MKAVYHILISSRRVQLGFHGVNLHRPTRGSLSARPAALGSGFATSGMSGGGVDARWHGARWNAASCFEGPTLVDPLKTL